MAGRWWGMRCCFFSSLFVVSLPRLFWPCHTCLCKSIFSNMCLCDGARCSHRFFMVQQCFRFESLAQYSRYLFCEQWKPLRGQMVGSTESEEVSFCQVLAYFFLQWLYHCIGGLPFLSAAWSWLQRRILGEMMPQSKKCPERIHENKGPLERFPLNSTVPNHFCFLAKKRVTIGSIWFLISHLKKSCILTNYQPPYVLSIKDPIYKPIFVVGGGLSLFSHRQHTWLISQMRSRCPRC